MLKKANDDFIHFMSFSISSETRNWEDLVPKTLALPYRILYPITPLIKALVSLFVAKLREPDISRQMSLPRRAVETEKTEDNDWLL